MYGGGWGEWAGGGARKTNVFIGENFAYAKEKKNGAVKLQREKYCR